MFNLIVCKDTNNIIGVNGDLYIKIKKDLKYFSNITKTKSSDLENIVVMGYNTWSSIKKKLPNRKNIVITKNHYLEFELNGYFVSIDNFVEWYLKNKNNYGEVYIIGGQQIYDQFLKNHRDKILNIYITNVQNNKHIEDSRSIKFNDDLSGFLLISSEKHNDVGNIYDFGLEDYVCKNIEYSFDVYKNIDHVNLNEDQYLTEMKSLIDPINIRKSRNGNVYSKFGLKMEFDLIDKFPLLTTKKTGWKTILKELLWFISGSTNNQDLVENKVNIWTQNADDYEKKSKFKSGDLGPVYGFQWRHFGAKYDGCDKNYKNQGYDQLNYIINEIKNNPTSRRLFMSSWNPPDLSNMALPPCHVSIQFYIQDEFIDAQFYQRSGDMFLGVPFNISSYSFLLYIIGNITGYKPRKLIHIIGDAHVYSEHIDSVKKQILRKSRSFPKLKIKRKIENIDEIDFNWFEIVDYNPCGVLKAPMIT